MQNTSVADSEPGRPRPGPALWHPFPTRGLSHFLTFSLFALFPLLLPGCAELVHEGQISDRELSSTVNDVRIEQQIPEGGWRHLGDTDGKGRWWIMKDKIHGAGKIRLTKPGYHPLLLSESEFLQATNLLMIPEDAGGRDPFN